MARNARGQHTNRPDASSWLHLHHGCMTTKVPPHAVEIARNDARRKPNGIVGHVATGARRSNSRSPAARRYPERRPLVSNSPALWISFSATVTIVEALPGSPPPRTNALPANPRTFHERGMTIKTLTKIRRFPTDRQHRCCQPQLCLWRAGSHRSSSPARRRNTLVHLIAIIAGCTAEFFAVLASVS